MRSRPAPDPECPIYNDGDPEGYYRQAASKLGLVNEAAGGHPLAGALAVLTTLYSEEYWPHLWAGLAWLQWYDEPETLLFFAKAALGGEPGAASFTGHVNCLDGLALNPGLDRATRFADDRLYSALFGERFPLLALLPGGASACPFYDQFAPAPYEEPLDGGGVPILVVGNHSDPATSFGESEELGHRDARQRLPGRDVASLARRLPEQRVRERARAPGTARRGVPRRAPGWSARGEE